MKYGLFHSKLIALASSWCPSAYFIHYTYSTCRFCSRGTGYACVYHMFSWVDWTPLSVSSFGFGKNGKSYVRCTELIHALHSPITITEYKLLISVFSRHYTACTTRFCSMPAIRRSAGRLPGLSNAKGYHRIVGCEAYQVKCCIDLVLALWKKKKKLYVSKCKLPEWMTLVLEHVVSSHPLMFSLPLCQFFSVVSKSCMKWQ